MPLPGKRPPYDFICPYRNYCPHLEGLSAGWVWKQYLKSGEIETEDCDHIHFLEQKLTQTQQRLHEAEVENEQLRAKLAALHKSRFKRKKKPPKNSTESDKTAQSDDSKNSGKKPRRGAPKGHPGWSRSKPDHVDSTVVVPAPSVCPDCGSEHLQPVDEIKEHIQEDIVLQPRTSVTCFAHHQAFCSNCRSNVIQSAEGEMLNCPIGPNTKAAAVFLRNGIGMSYRRVQDIMRVLFGIRFVPASAMAFDRKAAKAAEPIYDILLEKLRSSDVAFGDETHWREDGNSAFVWYGGNEHVAVYLIEPSRAGEVAAKLFGENFQGILHSDAYAGYNAINAKHRQTCLGHLITKAKDLLSQLELIRQETRDRHSLRFCRSIKSFFQLTCSIANKFRNGQILRSKADLFHARLDATLKSICSTPCQFDAAENLRSRLLDPKREYLKLFTFLHHPGVHPTNNHSEQSLRWLVIFRKICFGTRSEAGSRSLSVLASVIVTARRHGAHPLDLTLSLFSRSAKDTLKTIFDPSNAPRCLPNKDPP